MEDLEQVKFLLGHSSIRATEPYLGSDGNMEHNKRQIRTWVTRRCFVIGEKACSFSHWMSLFDQIICRATLGAFKGVTSINGTLRTLSCALL